MTTGVGTQRRMPPWWPTAGILAALGWVLIRSGSGVLSSREQPIQAAQLWPQRLQDQYASFLSDSPVGLIAFKITRIESDSAYLLLHLFACVLAIGLLAWWAAAAAERGARSRSARLSILAPLSAILLAWIGAYDPWTMLAWALCLATWLWGRRWAMVAGGLMLGFQHFEHGLLGALALTLTWAALRDDVRAPLTRVSPAWFLPGIALGKALLALVFILNGQPLSGRVTWVQRFIPEWSAVAANIAPLLLWSLFAGSWAIVVALFVLRTTRRQQVMLASALAVGALALALSGDRPRVFVIVMAPALLLGIVCFSNRMRAPALRTQAITLETIVWLAPPVIFWGKEVVNQNVIDLWVIALQNFSGG